MSMRSQNSQALRSNPAVGSAFQCYNLSAFAKYAVLTSGAIRTKTDALTAIEISMCMQDSDGIQRRATHMWWHRFYPELVKPPAPQHDDALTKKY